MVAEGDEEEVVGEEEAKRGEGIGVGEVVEVEEVVAEEAEGRKRVSSQQVGSTSLGAARTRRRGTAASPRRSSSPGHPRTQITYAAVYYTATAIQRNIV